MLLNEIVERLQKEGSNPVRKNFNLTFGTNEEVKDLFIETFKIVDQTVEEFEFLSEYREVIEYLSDAKGKGLAMFGSFGRGKSVILTGILPVLFRLKMNMNLKAIAAINLRKFPEYVDRWAYAIDDVGTEPIVNDFGTKYEPFDEILNTAESRIKPLFFNTNLSKDEFCQRYGERGFDRVQRLCRIIVFKGESLRK